MMSHKESKHTSDTVFLTLNVSLHWHEVHLMFFYKIVHWFHFHPLLTIVYRGSTIWGKVAEA